MTQLASDDFNRADVNPLSPVSAPWVRAQSADNTFQVLSNLCAPQAVGADSSCVYATVTWPNDQYSQATISASAGGGSATGVGVIVRGTTGLPANGSYYRAICDTSTGDTTVDKIVAGVFTNLGGAIAGTWVNGDVVRLEIVADLLTVYRNGVSVGTRNDSAIASGAAGIAYSSTATTPRLDDWSAGSIDAPAVGYPIAWIRA